MNKLSKNTKALIIIFFIALVARIFGPLLLESRFFGRAFLIFGQPLAPQIMEKQIILYNLENGLISDEVIFSNTAQAIAEKHGYSLNFSKAMKTKNFALSDKQLKKSRDAFYSLSKSSSSDTAYRSHRLVPPIYPFFLAACFSFFGINTLAFYIPQLILGTLTCVFIYLLAKELFGIDVAILAGIFVALYPDLVFWTHTVRPETLYIFLIAAGFYYLTKGNIRKEKTILYLGWGFFCLAALTKITLIFFLPLVIIWQLFAWDKNKLMSFFICCSLIIIGCAILLPWTIRNYLVFSEFTPITSEAGAVLVEHMKNNEIIHVSSTNYLVQLFSFIQQNPNEYILLSFSRLLKYLGPITPQMRNIAKIYKFITWMIIVPSAIAGIFVTLKEKLGKDGLLIIFILYYILLHTATVVDNGLIYRYPIQPILAIFSAQAYLSFSRFLKGNRKQT